jgi:hypothetical protein
MQVIKSLPAALLATIPFIAYAQSSYLPSGSRDLILLERLEIKAQRDSVLNFSHIRPFNRKWWVQSLDRLEGDSASLGLTRTDLLNIRRARMNNLEWVGGDKSGYRSKRPVLKSFFPTPVNLVEVDRPDFFLSVNPVLQFSYLNDDRSTQPGYQNTRGFTARAQVGGKFGFYTYVTENQERAPAFVNDWFGRYGGFPGVGANKPFKGGPARDYFDARGGIMFNVAKYLDLQFGYDRAFLGNGYRSLFLSDFGANHLFLNMNLKVWKLNYISRVMELNVQYDRGIRGDTVLPRKYMAIHHISFSAPRWLTLGLFSSVVFGRANHVEFGYLNPIIFLRPMEMQVGSPDNALMGFDAKVNITKGLQLYGQLLFDEFLLNELKKGEGSWVNKWGLQAGLKYIDVAGVDNLDLQVELNAVRPFTYSHKDTVGNYSHYNLPLAHPLMSNFVETLAILRYQPAPRWYLQGRVTQWVAGTDRGGVNWGNNIFQRYTTRVTDYGFTWGAPDRGRYLNANLWAAYEWRDNLFFEVNATLRKSPQHGNNVMLSAGMRWNIARREFDF